MQKVVGAYFDTFSMPVLCRGTRTQPGLQATAVLGSMHRFTQKLRKRTETVLTACQASINVSNTKKNTEADLQLRIECRNPAAQR